MKRKVFLLAALVLMIGSAYLHSADRQEFREATPALSAEGQRIVDYLLEDWGKRFRSTSISLAMSNLEIKPDDDLRLQVGEYFRENSDLAKNLKWWGANNYILSNLEKRIAKYLIGTFNEEQRLPSLKELSQAIGVNEKELEDRLAFMARAGLLEESDDTKLSYILTKRYKRWGGPLRYNFHTVDIEGQKPFDVW